MIEILLMLMLSLVSIWIAVSTVRDAIDFKDLDSWAIAILAICTVFICIYVTMGYILV